MGYGSYIEQLLSMFYGAGFPGGVYDYFNPKRTPEAEWSRRVIMEFEYNGIQCQVLEREEV